MDSDAGEGTGAACEALALERDFPVDFIEIETNLASENARTQRLCRPQGSFSLGKQQRALADKVTRGGLRTRAVERAKIEHRCGYSPNV